MGTYRELETPMQKSTHKCGNNLRKKKIKIKINSCRNASKYCISSNITCSCKVLCLHTAMHFKTGI
jgi:hypothetical protein